MNLRLVTWNINSIRIRLDHLKKLVEIHDPDVICLQEIKVRDEEFPIQECKDLGFDYINFIGEKSYNGTAILSKFKPDTHFSIKLYNNDSRHIAIKIKDIEIHNFYIPAGGDIPDVELNTKFKHKLSYIDQMKEWFLDNRISQNDKIILVGDLNIAPFEHDVWSSKKLKNIVSHTDIERTKLINFITECGLVDVGRKFVPMEQKLYSWWTYRSKNSVEADKGRRLDHILCSKQLEPYSVGYFTLKEARSWLRPSDHIPVIADFNIHY